MVARKTPRRVLVIDLGGTHLKLRSDGPGPFEEFVSGPKMTRGRITRDVRKLVKSSAGADFRLLGKPRAPPPG